MSWLTGKDPDDGKDWGQNEKEVTEHEIVGWQHQLNRYKFEQASGDKEGQGSWHPAVHGVTKNWTQLRDWMTTTRLAVALILWLQSPSTVILRSKKIKSVLRQKTIKERKYNVREYSVFTEQNEDYCKLVRRQFFLNLKKLLVIIMNIDSFC